MPVAIIGMHRSGTSLVAHLLNRGGLNLGREDELIGASPDNPDGYWEHIGFHRVNESVLTELGGGWDNPPAMPKQWGEDARLAPYAIEARRLIASFDQEPWGWKDPRTSITLRLWLELIPELKVVVCVRNPLEVAVSLNRRGMFSYSNALKLWQTYNERILAACDSEQMIITDYSEFFSRPEAELERVLAHLGLRAPTETIQDAAKLCRAELRHVRFEFSHLLDVHVRDEIVELYAAMSGSTIAGGRNGAAASELRQPDRASARIVDEHAAEAQVALQQRPWLQSQVEHLHDELRARDEELSHARDRESQLVDELALLRDRLAGLEGELRTLNDVHDSFYTLESALRPSSAGDPYADQLDRIKGIIRRETPSGSAIAVVSKGDERLLGFYGRSGMHFPQTDAGIAIGYHPPCGLSAIAHLEALRARGADFLLLPSPSLWWLEYYPDFARHLNSRFRRVWWDSAAGVLFALAAPPDRPARLRAAAADLLAALRSGIERSPTLLDWNTGLELVNALPQAHLFAQDPERGPLPYPDESVDVVAVASSDPAATNEAVRVASVASIVFSPEHEWPSLELKPPARAVPVDDVSVVVDGGNGPPPSYFLRSLAETLPEDFGGEIVFVGSGPMREGEPFAPLTLRHARARVIGVAPLFEANSAVNQGVQVCGEQWLILLRATTVLLPDWLRPLLNLLRGHPQAGAAGGLVLAADGSLLQAGGRVFSNGSALHLGYGQPNPTASTFDYVHKVDFCSSRMLATRRDVFLELSRFPSSLPGPYADVDYCMSLRQQGMDVYVQPASAVVDLASRDSDVLRDAGMQPAPTGAAAALPASWKAMLRQQPSQPETLDLETLTALSAS